MTEIVDPPFVPVIVPKSRFAASRFWRLMPAGMRRRWWLFRPFDLLARHWPVLGPRRGLLVVRMDGIGDMVLFRASLEGYARAFGVRREDIVVLGCASWAEIAGEVFAGFRVVAIDEHAYARRPLYRFRVSRMVRRLKVETAVCDAFFRRALMADSLVWVSRAPRTVVSLPYVGERTRAEYTYYLSQATTVVDTGPYPTHETVRHARFLAAITGEAARPAPPAIRWRERPPPLPAGEPYVVLNPESNEPGRRWPFAAYAEIARRLRARDLRVVLVGGGEQPRPGFEALARDRGIVDLAGRTRLPELLDVLKHARAAVSNDSGPAHASIALGTPTVVVVGGGHFGSFVPYPEAARPPHARFVFQRMECYHCFWRCHKRADPKESFPCVAEVGVDRVWRELEDILAGTERANGPRAKAAVDG